MVRTEKFCKNCKHFKKSFEECHHPKNIFKDPLYGVDTTERSARVLRTDFGFPGGDDMCGPEGHWFEPKEDSE
jgi:hypothetical protein